MTTIQYGTMCRDGFKRAITKLAHFGEWEDYKVLFEVKKFMREYQATTQTAQQEWYKIIERHAEKDEKGQVKPHEGRPGTFIIPDDKQETFQQEKQKYDAKVAEFTITKIPFEAVKKAGFSAMDLIELEWLIDCELTTEEKQAQA